MSQPAQFPSITIDKVIRIVKVVKQLKEKGETEENNPELAKMIQFLKYCSHHQQQIKDKINNIKQDQLKSQAGSSQTLSSIGSISNNILNASPSTSTPIGLSNIPSTTEKQLQINDQHKPIEMPPLSTFPHSFDSTDLNINNKNNQTVENERQLALLQHQIIAYRNLSKNKPLPPQLRRLLWLSSLSDDEKRALDDPVINTDSVEFGIAKSIVQSSNIEPTSTPTPLSSQNSQQVSQKYQPQSKHSKVLDIIYPEQILLDKFKEPASSVRLQRLLVPSISPYSFDIKDIVAEQNRKKQNYVEFRKNALKDQLLLDSKSEHRLRIAIELKSLSLLDKQKKLRNDIINGANKMLHIPNASERAFLKRAKKQSLREARENEKLERMQRAEREKIKKAQHSEQLAAIINHGRELITWHRTQTQRISKLGKAVQQFHAHVEREEQKRQERISRERLQALRADDEEAYLKLIDHTKETRITHLLQQTNQYLNTLTEAVKTQQDSVGVTTEEVERPAWAITNEELDDDSDKLDYYSISHRINEKVTEQPNILIGGDLKDYQLRGLEWMVSLYNNRLNGILADEMGLGKTIQTISLITYLIEKKKQPGPFLIIVPLSTITNWIQEFEKWAPEVVCICHKGSPAQRKEMVNHIKRGAFNVVLTTYDFIIRDRLILSKAKWVHMIIDEGHRMKNVNSKLAITLTQHYNTRYRLILTGTPLQNNLPELWALLNFVLPHIFHSVKSFDEWFNAPFAGTNGQDRIDLNEEEQLLIIKRLHKVLRPFLLRRLKKDVESDLPDKTEHIIRCRMSALQNRLYHQVRKFGTLFNDDTANTNSKKKSSKGVNSLNNTIMQLRKICNHPFVFESVEEAINPSRTNNPQLYRTAGKFELLDRILPKLVTTGHKILIFFQMTQVMTIMEDWLNWRGIRSLRLDGSTSDDVRREHMNNFNKDPTIKVFLLSTRAGGQGLNLQTADTVIIFDSDWNPHQDLQAQDRAHRIGQKNEVKILRLITRRSVEETILQRAQFKLDIDGKVIQAGKFDNKSTAEEREQFLRSLLQDGELREEDDDCSDENINLLISRSDEERTIFDRMDAERIKVDKHDLETVGVTEYSPNSRLISDNELPKYYLKDYDPQEVRRRQLAAEVVDKSRRHSVVHYDDGLTEEQWLDALEDDNVDLDEYIKETREKRTKRHKTPILDNDDTPEQELLTPQTKKLSSVKKRGRPKKPFEPELEEYNNTQLLDEKSKHILKSDISNEPDLLENDSNSSRMRKSARVVGAFDDDSGSVTVPGTPITPTTTNIPFAIQNLNSISSSMRKKRKIGANTTADILNPKERKDLVNIMQESYKTVFNVWVEEEGYSRQQCELFLDLPNKKEYPDYYIVIKKPISMKLIKKRIKASSTFNPPTNIALTSSNPNALSQYSYSSLEQLHEDFIKMFNNARLYNEEGSMVYEDADNLQKILEKFLSERSNKNFITWKGSNSQKSNEMPEEWVSAAHQINTALSARGIDGNAINPESKDNVP
ncbi:hypothetical protein BB561_000696 [Smittium simulii]|uniref:Uncharacterized protein n=1 Tax=Smittium simulii TaxID=133385 RepID=A0A2T9YXX0_9FUNG|nr:hypothetical protein BB561_000696 [Smittium simulii]